MISMIKKKKTTDAFDGLLMKFLLASLLLFVSVLVLLKLLVIIMIQW